MDLSAVMTTLLSSDSVKNLSKKTGSSQKDVTNVLTRKTVELCTLFLEERKTQEMKNDR